MLQAEVPGTRAPAVHSALSETGGPSNRGHGERGTSRAERAALSERGSHRRHHPEGGGDSEHVFALCSLLGFQFAPRISDLKHRGLYSFDKPFTYPTLEPLIGGRIGAASSEPGVDFEGGEFMLTEQRPRMQTRGAVVPLRKGDGVLFAVNTRPVRGGRGDYRVNLRQGVSQVRSGHRHTLGVIFHDAA